jgi:hypothetical protein
MKCILKWYYFTNEKNDTVPNNILYLNDIFDNVYDI